MTSRQAELERGNGSRGEEHSNVRRRLRQRIGRELESLSEQLSGRRAVASDPVASQRTPAGGSRAGRVELAAAQGRVRWLGQLMAGLADGHDPFLDDDAAGFGSTVHVVDQDSGRSLTFTLMSGASMDVSADQVSMESPIGAELVGARSGDDIVVTTPAGVRRFRVERVVTLPRMFGLAA